MMIFIQIRINVNGNTLTFNGYGFVDVGTDQTITGKKTFAGVNSGNIQINPTTIGFDDGLRISRTDPPDTGNSSIQLGYSRTSNTGDVVGQWSIFIPPISAEINPQSFVKALSSQAGDNTRGQQISADGNTLTFNGQIIAGTDTAICSVNY
ncbi:MAG: hypothetical protein EZS28_020832, partial [Streblomastix strix]